jgi:SAM-dependent methyltransferase
VADTPLCHLDEQIVAHYLPPLNSDPQTALDLGCGTGRLAIPLAARGYQVLGVDLSHRMLEQMLAKAGSTQAADGDDCGPPANLMAKLMAVQANLVDLDCLATDSADHAICMFSTLGMIQGQSNRIQFLRHVCRAVRPQGTLIVHVHRRWAALREIGGVRRLFRSWIDSVRRKDWEFGDATYAYRGLEDMFMHRFTVRQVTSELKAAGWTIERLHKVDLRGNALTDSTWDSSGMFVVCRN